MPPGSVSSRRCRRFPASPRCLSSTSLAERRRAVRQGGHHAHGLRHGDRTPDDRNPASGRRRLRDLRRDLLRVDPDDATCRCLCAARGAALRPQLRTAAAVGLGGLRGRRTGLRALGRCDCGKASDLGDRRGCRVECVWFSLGLKPLDAPTPAAAEVHGDSRLLRDAGFLAVIATSALVQGSHAVLLHLCLDRLASRRVLAGFTIAGLWVLRRDRGGDRAVRVLAKTRVLPGDRAEGRMV